MSLHNYQYANSNPTRYTDPSGYFSMGEAVTTIALSGIIAGLYGGLGVVGYKYLTTGLSEQDVYSLYGDWFHGYANGASGGITADVTSLATQTPVTPNNQGAMWHMGHIAGIGTLMLMGLKSPQWAAGKMGPLKLLGTFELGTQAYGFGKSIGNFGMGLQDGWSWTDSFNLISVIMYGVGIRGSVGQTLAAAKATNQGGNVGRGSVSSADEAVKNAGKTTATVGSQCFVAGTEILTTEGMKHIEDICEGDWVISDDPTTPGEIESKQVTDAFVRHTDRLVDLYIDGEIISTTGEHPFWTADKGWVEARDLTLGSLLQTEDGRIIDVDKIEQRKGDFTVYNFKVGGFHTYFVSELGILVHNAICPDEIRQILDNSPMRTQQERVSLPKIERYAEQLKQGQDLGRIKVDGDIIVDGHHRYIAGQVAGVDVPTSAGSRPTFKQGLPSQPIKNIELNPNDF
jgi:hypothetical protein